MSARKGLLLKYELHEDAVVFVEEGITNLVFWGETHDVEVCSVDDFISQLYTALVNDFLERLWYGCQEVGKPGFRLIIASAHFNHKDYLIFTVINSYQVLDLDYI